MYGYDEQSGIWKHVHFALLNPIDNVLCPFAVHSTSSGPSINMGSFKDDLAAVKKEVLPLLYTKYDHDAWSMKIDVISCPTVTCKWSHRIEIEIFRSNFQGYLFISNRIASHSKFVAVNEVADLLYTPRAATDILLDNPTSRWKPYS